ncbi:DUF6282 family protein [Rhodoplanes azumiensis]|uniref:DUF6282 family protein n=1 Tax=Rhodoplanes azumiensis TaxID=1897628 RepID=A0ABW5AJ51_9BRAD
MTSRDDTEVRIDRLLRGAVDPHVHSGPSIAPRALDHVALLRAASAAGFAAVVTKDHDYSSVVTAALIRTNFPELTTKIYPSIVLNNVVGGFNPHAVEHTAAMGGKIVWLPTLAAENHLRWQAQAQWSHPASTDRMRPPVGIPVLDAGGGVRDEVKAVLDIVARFDVTLASGHLHIGETWVVFEEAKRRGVTRLILTHPEEIVGASLDDVAGMAAFGAHVEHSLAMFVEGSRFKIAGAEALRRHIEAAGVEKTILCSDLGQVGSVDPIEGFRRGIAMCLELGYDDDQIRHMVSLNAARVLGLEADLPAAA